MYFSLDCGHNNCLKVIVFANLLKRDIVLSYYVQACPL